MKFYQQTMHREEHVDARRSLIASTLFVCRLKTDNKSISCYCKHFPNSYKTESSVVVFAIESLTFGCVFYGKMAFGVALAKKAN